MNNKFSTASLKSIKSSPLKVMRVARNVRGLKIEDAIKLLKFSKLKLAPIFIDLIKSAMSNAENNHNMDADNLYIARVDIGRAFALKRFATRGRGKSSRILKTFSNIKVYLAEKSVEEPVKKATKNQKKGE